MIKDEYSLREINVILRRHFGKRCGIRRPDLVANPRRDRAVQRVYANGLRAAQAASCRRPRS
jgi:hypothetical protein